MTGNGTAQATVTAALLDSLAEVQRDLAEVVESLSGGPITAERAVIQARIAGRLAEDLADAAAVLRMAGRTAARRARAARPGTAGTPDSAPPDLG